MSGKIDGNMQSGVVRKPVNPNPEYQVITVCSLQFLFSFSCSSCFVYRFCGY